MATPPAILVSTLLTRITPPSINGRVGRQRRTGAPALYRMPPGTSWGPTYKRGAPPILGVSPMAWFIAQSEPHIQASISKIECITTFFAQISAQKDTGQQSQPDSQAPGPGDVSAVWVVNAHARTTAGGGTSGKPQAPGGTCPSWVLSRCPQRASGRERADAYSARLAEKREAYGAGIPPCYAAAAERA